MSKSKVLVVEDDPDVRLGYHVLLTANGYDTYFATDSLTAISEGRECQPDLIILDLGLPAGDGFTVMKRFRTNPLLAPVPVIVVSARDALANKQRALEAGAKAFLQKPWDNIELLALIARFLGRAEPARTASL